MYIKKIICNSLLFILAKLPLSVIRMLGAALGLIILRFSNKSAKRLPHNLLITGLATPDNVKQMTNETAKALGMTFIEAALIAWQKNPQRINQLSQTDESFSMVRQLIDSGQNIVFLTPHLGNFEVLVKYFAYNLAMDLQILYKPAKDPFIEELLLNGRTETNITTVPTTRKGIVSLIKHLNAGGCIGILPDNVASSGDGEWVKFFKQDVYATSLAAKIYQMPDTHVIVVTTKRTKTGFFYHCEQFKSSHTDTQAIMQDFYILLEKLVRQTPHEYYWSYDRFRHPDGAKAKPANWN